MSRRKSKVTSINRGTRLNFGVIVFLFIFLYLVSYLIFYLTKDHITLYQVTESGIAQDNTFNGIVLRKEKVVKTNSAGYVAYYTNDKSRVRVGDTVYSIDESGNTLKSLTSDKAVTLDESDYYQIRSSISDFSKDYSDNEFKSVYTFKEAIDNKVFEITSGTRYNNLEELENTSSLTSLNVVKAKTSGTVSYVIDGLESLTKKDVNIVYFDDYDYTCDKRSTGTLLEKKSPVYKVLTSDKWNIIIHLNEDQYNLYKEQETVKIRFNKTSKKAKADIECYEKDGEYFACLTLYKYAVQFIDDRFLSIDILSDSSSGLKIPNTAITSKDFYVVPKKLFTKGGDSDSLGLIAYIEDDNNQLQPTFVATEIYNETKNNYYINAKLFEEGTLVNYPDNQGKTYTLSKIKSLDGVFNANNGYCEFRKVEVLYKNDQYSIISSDTPYGLSIYDNIVYNSETADEDLIIY